MADQPARRNDFKFILNSVRTDAVDAVAHELTQIFPLDDATATNIVRNAPIILLDNLSPKQGRLVGTYAIRLKALGADVQVTGQPVGKLQVLKWPLLPDIAKRPGNHVICPNCGARLQVQIFVPPAEPERPASLEGGPADTGIVKPITDSTDAGAGEPAAETVAPVAASESTDEPEEEEKPAEEEAIEEVILEPIDSESDEEDEALESMADEDEDEEEEEAMINEPSPAIEVASDVPTAVGGEGNCRVSIIGKVKGKKKLKTAAIMARYLGIEEPEALERLGKKTVVAVATGLTQKQADACKKEFADIGVKVTIKG